MKKGKIKLSNLIIFLIILVILIFVVIGAILLLNNEDAKENVIANNNGGTQNNENWEAKRFDGNNWDSTIVSEIVQGIPIPNGFKYVQGDINTGILVSNENLGIEMLWIPYDEKATEINTDEYFANVGYYEIESDIMKSIEKYAGFFVFLYGDMEYSELKNISSEKYDELNKSLNLNNNANSINSHLLYKEELQQIEYYLKNNNIEYVLGTTGVTIEIYSTIYKEETTQSSDINTLVTKYAATESVAAPKGNKKDAEVYMLKTNAYESKVPIPLGFKYSIDESGIVSIQNENNKNLIYVWVPLTKEKLETSKNELKQLYASWTNADGDKLNLDSETDLAKSFYASDSLSDEFKTSIEKYGGFYISEAELSYDSKGNFYNKARGMVGFDVAQTKSGGNYFRENSDYPTLHYNNIIEIASKVEESNPSVESHLSYGVEYDATILWIANSNKDFKDSNGNDIVTTLIYDSTYVGKYSNSGYASNASAVESGTFFNGIWGLGGNLFEITQERQGGFEYVLRGGSYRTTGQAMPIASRKIYPNSSDIDIGFRVSLYVNPNAKEVTQSYSKFEKDTKEDYLEEIITDVENENTQTTTPENNTVNDSQNNSNTGNTSTNNSNTNNTTTNNNPSNSPTEDDSSETNPSTEKSPSLSVASNTVELGKYMVIGMKDLPENWTWKYFLSNQGTCRLGAPIMSSSQLHVRGEITGSTTVIIYIYDENGNYVKSLSTKITVVTPKVTYSVSGYQLKVGDEVTMSFYRPKDFSIKCSSSNEAVLAYRSGTGGNAFGAEGNHSGKFLANGAGSATWTVTWTKNKQTRGTSSKTFVVSK